MMVDVGIGYVLEGEMPEPVERGLDIDLSGVDAVEKFSNV
jgi:hypothetical protein